MKTKTKHSRWLRGDLTGKEIADGKKLSTAPVLPMPKTRGECPTERPCPHIRCRHHLMIDVTPGIEWGSSVQVRWESLEDMPATCSLDVAEYSAKMGGISLNEVGSFLGVTRERARQIEGNALDSVARRMKKISADRDDWIQENDTAPNIEYAETGHTPFDTGVFPNANRRRSELNRRELRAKNAAGLTARDITDRYEAEAENTIAKYNLDELFARDETVQLIGNTRLLNSKCGVPISILEYYIRTRLGGKPKKTHRGEFRPMIQVKVKKTSSDAKLPRYVTNLSSGMDLTAIEDTHIYPGEWKMIRTGLCVELPRGYEGQVRPQSGMSMKYGITVLNSPGTIDCDYRGEIMVILINLSTKKYNVIRGDRIAQLVIAPVSRGRVVEVELLGASDRGVNGLGSSRR